MHLPHRAAWGFLESPPRQTGGSVGGGWALGAGKLSSKEPEGYGGKEDVSSRAATLGDSCQSACGLGCPATPQVRSVPTHVG